jgi:protein ImuA
MMNSGIKKHELSELRQQIAEIEERQFMCLNEPDKEPEKLSNIKSYRIRNKKDKNYIFPFGYSSLDECLDGGIFLNALTEFRTDEARHVGSASGFVWILAQQMQKLIYNLEPAYGTLPILWIGEVSAKLEGGQIYPPGLLSLGIDPSQCIFVQPRTLNDALWAAELAAKQTALATTILEVRGNPGELDMAGTRRLHLRAQAAKRPFFLLKQSSEPEATAARTRIFIKPAAASSKILPSQQKFSNSLQYSAFQLLLEKSKSPSLQSFILEWNHDAQSFHKRTDQDWAKNQDHDQHTDVDVYKYQSSNFVDRSSLSGNGPNQAKEMGRVVAFG